MSRIRATNTEPERLLRSRLWRRGLRYRVNARTPAGRADIVFKKAHVAVFIDGCFWHGCPDHYVRPRSRTEFWATKLRENVERDRRQTRELEASGWIVIRAWEHEVFESIEALADSIVRATQGVRSRSRRRRLVVGVDALDANGDLECRHHVDLRDDTWAEQVEQRRHTRKWARPATTRSGQQQRGAR